MAPFFKLNVHRMKCMAPDWEIIILNDIPNH
jgi:hypothetical protein